MPEPTPSSSPTAVPTAEEVQVSEPVLVSLPGGYAYGDPDSRFSLPLLGEWSLVETDSSYGRFTFDDPPLELYVVIAETEDLEEGTNEALQKIGVEPSELSLLSDDSTEELPGWSVFLYSLEDEQGIALAAQVMDGETVAFIATGEVNVLTSEGVSSRVVYSINNLALIPLNDYLECDQDPPPTSVEAIEYPGYIEFCSGRTKLVGRLTLPEGEGPFPAIVYTGPGSGLTSRFDYNPYYLPHAGFAIFSYDKRGAGDSEGVFVEAGLGTGEWRLPQLADDALAAVAFLQGLEEINPNQIGLAGWSQNGWTIPVAASKSDAVAFVLINAGPTVSMGEELFWSELSGGRDPISASMREELSEQLAAYDGPRGFDPRPYIEAMSIPGLWILGDKDGSIPARESKAILESIIEEYDKDFSIFYYPDAGHGVAVPTSKVADWIYAHLEE
jgi:dienelactone hydrolase